MNPVKEMLLDARARIAEPDKWAQGWFAMSADKEEVFSNDDKAVCWCSLGTLSKSRTKLNATENTHTSCRELLDLHMEGDTPTFNDNHTHAEVLAAWDAAIASLE